MQSKKYDRGIKSKTFYDLFLIKEKLKKAFVVGNKVVVESSIPPDDWKVRPSTGVKEG